MTRADVRLDDGAMDPVSCASCDARVLVRKSSWEQTSIQWTADAAGQCQDRQAWSASAGPNGGAFPGCASLAAAIAAAAVGGTLHVQIEDALPVNPEVH